MKLTKIQLKTLQFFQMFRTKPLTIWRWLSFNWFAWLPLIAFGFVGFLLTFGSCAVFGWLTIGMAGGAFLRDVGRARVMMRVWSLYQEIINWQRVTELLESHKKPDT